MAETISDTPKTIGPQRWHRDITLREGEGWVSDVQFRCSRGSTYLRRSPWHVEATIVHGIVDSVVPGKEGFRSWRFGTASTATRIRFGELAQSSPPCEGLLTRYVAQKTPKT